MGNDLGNFLGLGKGLADFCVDVNCYMAMICKNRFFGCVFPEGITVYNFTVDGNHNYFGTWI